MIAAFGLCLVVVALTGGDLRRLADVRFRAPGLVLAGLGLQLVITTIVEVPEALGQVLHLVSYVPIVTFVALNWRRPGLVMLAAGTMCNVAAITANGGTMPSDAQAVERAGLDLGRAFANSAPVAHPKLLFLGDIFAVPKSWPFANVFSVGDLLIVGGGVWFVAAVAYAKRSAPGSSDSTDGSDGTDTDDTADSDTDVTGRVLAG